MSKLTRWTNSKTGKVRRIYIERKGLKARLWFEKDDSPLGGPFAVHFYGNEFDFSVSRVPGEPVQITEAREVLAEFKLDIKSCTWEEIVANAE
jgi:hypothetical protein